MSNKDIFPDDTPDHLADQSEGQPTDTTTRPERPDQPGEPNRSANRDQLRDAAAPDNPDNPDGSSQPTSCTVSGLGPDPLPDAPARSSEAGPSADPAATPSSSPDCLGGLPHGLSGPASNGTCVDPSGKDSQNPAECHDDAPPVEFSHPADVAEHLENLPLQEQVSLVRALAPEDAAEALAELDERTRVELLENLDPDTAAEIVGEMSFDDAADVLDELDQDHSVVLLSKLESEDAEEIRNLMAFDPETAGGVMNTEIIILEQDITADQAVQQIRNEVEYKEVPYYAYIVTGDDFLAGVISLRDLLISPPGTPLRDLLADQELISVTFDTDREEVARVIGHYNFMALPVVDHEGRLLGVISHDDVIDIIQDLASEDMLGMVGAGQDETTDTPWLESVKMRLPWLLVNMFNSALSAAVVYLFDGTIEQMAILAVFMPMVANQAGNTGQQALAVIIRQMATEKFSRRKAWNAVLREGKIGMANSLILGILVWIGVFLFTSNAALTSVMVSALMMDMVLGAFAGGSIPVLLKEMGRDPAQASSIFLTAITDGAGFFLFLGLATLFLL